MQNCFNIHKLIIGFSVKDTIINLYQMFCLFNLLKFNI